jgi:hypothetical protein
MFTSAPLFFFDQLQAFFEVAARMNGHNIAGIGFSFRKGGLHSRQTQVN